MIQFVMCVCLSVGGCTAPPGEAAWGRVGSHQNAWGNGHQKIWWNGHRDEKSKTETETDQKEHQRNKVCPTIVFWPMFLLCKLKAPWNLIFHILFLLFCYLWYVYKHEATEATCNYTRSIYFITDKEVNIWFGAYKKIT